MKETTRAALSAPYRRNRADGAAPYILMTAVSAFVWTTMDPDSFYMVTEGRAILENMAIHRSNPYSYYPGTGLVIQQWLYCVGMALAAKIPANMGLLAFMLAQLLAVFHAVRRTVMGHTKDGFLGTVAAMAACLACTPAYFYSLRPENMTLLLLLLEIWALDRYRASRRPGWLLLLPLSVVLEMNLHGSMWPFHLCVWLAYAVPGLAKLRLRDASLWRDWRFLAAGASMVPATLMNPYGIDGALYVFRSMEIFKHVSIAEQNAPDILSEPAIFSVLCLAGIVVMARLARTALPESHMAYLAAGFSAAAMLNYHSAMFMPIALCMLACCAFDAFGELSPAVSTDTMPCWLRIPLWAACAVMLLAACAVRLPAMGQFDKGDGYAAAVAYVATHQQPGESVVNHFDVGSQLEYYGVRGILTDSRPEMMLASVNGSCDIWEDYAWLDTGEGNAEKSLEYKSIGGYLDHWNIQYIIESREKPAYEFLMGWLDRDGGWEKAEISDRCLYDVWVRKQK